MFGSQRIPSHSYPSLFLPLWQNLPAIKFFSYHSKCLDSFFYLCMKRVYRNHILDNLELSQLKKEELRAVISTLHTPLDKSEHLVIFFLDSDFTIGQLIGLFVKCGLRDLCEDYCTKAGDLVFFETLIFPDIFPEEPSVRPHVLSKVTRAASGTIKEGLNDYPLPCTFFENREKFKQQLMQAFSGKILEGVNWEDIGQYILTKIEDSRLVQSFSTQFENNKEFETVLEQAKEFYLVTGYSSQIPFKLLVNALGACGFEELCRDICEEANEGFLFKQLHFAPVKKRAFERVEPNDHFQMAKKIISDQAKKIAALQEENLVLKTKKQENSDCVICLDKPRTIVAIPCGHLAYCDQCSVQIKACAICKNAIANMVKTYYS